MARRGLSALHFTAEQLAVFDPLPKLARGNQPLLVLHGTRDSLIRPPEGQAAFDHAGTTSKRLTWLEGHRHNDVSSSPAYWQVLAKFIAALR